MTNTASTHQAVIVDAVRTPIGRFGGALAAVRSDDLAALVIAAVVERTGIDPSLIDDVIFGCTNQAGEDNRNVARMATLIAGLPETVPGQTVNRLCASGLQAVASAAQAIAAGEGALFVAGGVESMTRAPFVMLKSEKAFPRGDQALVDSCLGWRFVNPALAERYVPYSMGETAENVAERCLVSREAQDAFAAESQRRAGQAITEGRFQREIVPVPVAVKRGTELVTTDEHPRPDTTVADLARLKPVFREGGSVTAGNSSGINDGAAAVLVADAKTARQLGLTPKARILGSAVVGLDPSVMGLGPIEATRRLLSRVGLAVTDLDVIELNEAFAAQAIPCIDQLGLDPAKVNPNGGAIALGHPLGATGARMMTTLLHELERSGGRYGLATLCIGTGQGMAMAIERLEPA
ncbi:MAG: acetyl-CoA C-acyltransferase [Thermomicrobiales bacterium]|nr:acetyl-CoA C-acyltransferase [Thermomicrobiales bacterium]MCO5221881.1 acetyl-CoA C-acyltransferase [Thermomicrobiales bacterium]